MKFQHAERWNDEKRFASVLRRIVLR